MLKSILKASTIAYWIAFGPHGPRALPDVNEKWHIMRVIVYCLAASVAIFSTSRYFARAPPKTMTKEWQEMSNEYLKVRQIATISPAEAGVDRDEYTANTLHPPGAKVGTHQRVLVRGLHWQGYGPEQAVGQEACGFERGRLDWCVAFAGQMLAFDTYIILRLYTTVEPSNFCDFISSLSLLCLELVMIFCSCSSPLNLCRDQALCLDQANVLRNSAIGYLFQTFEQVRSVQDGHEQLCTLGNLTTPWLKTFNPSPPSTTSTSSALEASALESTHSTSHTPRSPSNTQTSPPKPPPNQNDLSPATPAPNKTLPHPLAPSTSQLSNSQAPDSEPNSLIPQQK